MRRYIRRFAAVLVPVLLLVALGAAWRGHLPGPASAPAHVLRLLAFEPNAGQAPAPARFQAHTAAGTLLFAPNAVSGIRYPVSGERTQHATRTTRSTQSSVSIQFLGANPAVDLRAGDPLPGRVNYIRGKDPAGWHTDIPTYGAITYRDLYPGVDLLYTGTSRALKGTYTLAPHADPTRVRWRYQGAQTVYLDAQGNLEIPFSDSNSTLMEAVPVAWQERGGRRVAVAARYTLAADGTVGFALGAYDPTLPLVIDPTLSYASYLGGNDYDEGNAVALDAQGNMYIAGLTASLDFPTRNPYQGSCNTCSNQVFDAFVTKMNPLGTELIYSTYIGGSDDDRAHSLVVNAAGEAYIAGFTTSDDFPTTPSAYQPNNAGDYDAFVTRLNANGTGLIYSTYVGGSLRDKAWGLAVNNLGVAYFVGQTLSTDFPVANPYQAANADNGDAFIAKLAPDGAALLYSTYFGGTGADVVQALALDVAGAVYVTGYTSSTNFPGAGGYHGGPDDVFVSKLVLTGNTLVYSRYIGGVGDDQGWAIQVDTNGSASIAGRTASTDFPRASAAQSLYGGGTFDAFLTRLNSTGSTILYSTFLGGAGDDQAFGLALDPTGNAYLTGSTTSRNFPLAVPIQATYGGGNHDAFVARVNPTGGPLAYSTYLGGSVDEAGYGLAPDGTGGVIVTGFTSSSDFPVRGNPFQGTYHPAPSSADGFLARINPLPLVTPTPTPTGSPTPLPGPGLIAGGPGDQALPQADGAIVVWEDNSAGTWDIRAKNLATGRTFDVYRGADDQRYPAISGNLVVWQDHRTAATGWDIYGARLSGDTAGAAFVVFQDAGDQINPAVSAETVVWQSGQLAGSSTAKAAAPAGIARWDIVARTLGVGGAYTLTAGMSTTNINPAIDGGTVVWQSTMPTLTLGLAPAGHGYWDILGADTSTRVPYVISNRPNDKTNPQISDGTVVWQEFVSGTLQVPLPKGRWSINGARVDDRAAITVTNSLNNQTHPAIRGRKVVYQNQPAGAGLAPAGRGYWDIQETDLDTGTTRQVSAPGADATLPAITGGTVVWQQVAPGGDSDVYGTVCRSSFADVQPGDYFATAVDWLACAGVISGYADSTFRPYNTTTRAQLAKIVVRGQGWSVDVTGGPHFTDVPPEHPFYDVIETAFHRNIISGYADGSFRPGNNVTRGQLAKIIVGARGWLPDTTGGPHFTDVPPTHPFYRVVETAYHRNIISGYADTTFRVGNNATRGQIAKIFFGALNQ